MNADGVANGRTIQVVVDRLLDGYSVSIAVIDGDLQRTIAETMVATFNEAEAIARRHATENNIPWHKVAMICR